MRRHVIALASVGTAVLVAFEPLTRGRLPARYDLITYALPNRLQASQALRRFHLPLWDPSRFGGAPFLANSQTAVLYPPHWLLAPLPADRAMAWSMAAHLLIATAGTYVFAARVLRCSPLAAALAAGAVGLGGFVHGQLDHYEQVTSMAWLPWVLIATDGAVAARRWRDAAAPIAGLATAVALCALAGHTQYLYEGLALVTGYALLVARPRHRMLRATAGAALGLGVAAVQLIPTLALSRASVRSGGLSLRAANQLALPQRDVISAFLPDFGGAHAGSTEWWAWLPWAALALAGVALATGRGGRRAVALGVLSLTGAVLALGSSTPVFRAAHAVVPGMDLFRVPARWLLLPALCLPLLAGLGVDAIRRALPANRRAAMVVAGVVALAGAGLALADDAPGPGSLVLGGIAATAVIVAWFAAREWTARGPALGAAATLLVAAELLAANASSPAHDPTIEPLAVRVPIERGHRILSVGREPPGDTAAVRAALVPNTQVLDGLRSIDGYDGGLLLDRHWSRTMAALTGRAEFDPLATVESNVNATGGTPLRADWLAVLDVTRVAVHRPPFDVGRLLPTGSRELRVTAAGVHVWSVPSLGPVFLADGRVPGGLRLVRVRRRPERLVVDVPPAAGGATVVVSEAMSAGWHASGGLALRRHHDFLLSFTAPAAGGRVTLNYTAPGLAAGAAVSGLALDAVLGLLVLSRRRPSTS